MGRGKGGGGRGGGGRRSSGGGENRATGVAGRRGGAANARSASRPLTASDIGRARVSGVRNTDSNVYKTAHGDFTVTIKQSRRGYDYDAVTVSHAGRSTTRDVRQPRDRRAERATYERNLQRAVSDMGNDLIESSQKGQRR